MATRDLHSFFKRKKTDVVAEQETSTADPTAPSQTDLPSTSETRPSTSITETTITAPSATAGTSRGTGTSTADAVVSGPKQLIKKKVDRFQQKWLKIWPWLRYQDGEMFCASCKEARPNDTSNFVGKGSRDFKTSALKRHTYSKFHCNSLETIKAKKVNPLEKHALKVAQEKQKGIMSAMKSTYFMAKKHIANHLHRDLMDFLRFQNSPDAATLPEGAYSHNESQDEFREVICSIIEQGIREKLLTSDFIGVIIDESTDIAVTKTLIVYMTLVNHGMRETHFIRNVEIEGGSADIVTAKLKEVCNDMGVDSSKIMGFGSDGASVMMGKRGGVVAKLKEDNPDLIGIHCVAHRLALVTSQASKGVGYLLEYERKLGALFSYFHNSPARMKSLKEIQALLSEDNLRIAGLHTVRWLSMGNAVTTVHRVYSSILLSLENDSSNPTAKGLHNFFAKSSALLVTAYLRDVLGSIGILSKVFQRDNLIMTTVNPMIDSTKDCIKSMLETPATSERETRTALEAAVAALGDEQPDRGHCQVEYKSASISYSPQMIEQVDSLKTTFTGNIISNLESRFPTDDMSITSSFQVLDPGSMRKLPASSAELGNYGSTAINMLAEHYISVLPDHEACAKAEFPLFKKLVVDNYLNLTFEEMAKKVITDLGEEFPNIATLYQVALILPMSSAVCERGFSMQNVIKDCHRNRLTTTSVNRLTFICLEGPPYKEFSFEKAFLKWNAMKERRLAHAGSDK